MAYYFQDGDTIEVFQQQSGGGWGGREGDIPFFLDFNSFPGL